MYLEFFATTGLVGGGLFLWFIWRVISILGAQWRKMGEAELSLFLGISAATAAFLIHGLFDHFLAFTPTYVMIWVILGLVASLPNPDYARDLNPSEVLAQKKGRSSLI